MTTLLTKYPQLLDVENLYPLAWVNYFSRAWQPSALLAATDYYTPYVTHLWTTVALLMSIITLLTPSKHRLNMNRVLSLIHAAVVAAGAWYSLYNAPHTIFGSEGWGEGFDPFRALLADFSGGFMVYDFAYSVSIGDWAIVAHHIFCALGTSLCRGANSGSKELLGAFATAEISTPLMHIRELVRPAKDSKASSVPYDIASLAFAIVFLVFRVGFAPIVVYYTVITESNPMFFRISGFLVLMLSFFWASKIIRILYATVTGTKKKTQVKDSKKSE